MVVVVMVMVVMVVIVVMVMVVVIVVVMVVIVVVMVMTTALAHYEAGRRNDGETAKVTGDGQGDDGPGKVVMVVWLGWCWYG